MCVIRAVTAGSLGLSPAVEPWERVRRMSPKQRAAAGLALHRPPRPIQQGPSSLTAAPTCLLALPEGFQKALKHPPVARVLGWAPSNGPWGAASCGQEEEETWGGG